MLYLRLTHIITKEMLLAVATVPVIPVDRVPTFVTPETDVWVLLTIGALVVLFTANVVFMVLPVAVN